LEAPIQANTSRTFDAKVHKLAEITVFFGGTKSFPRWEEILEEIALSHGVFFNLASNFFFPASHNYKKVQQHLPRKKLREFHSTQAPTTGAYFF